MYFVRGIICQLRLDGHSDDNTCIPWYPVFPHKPLTSIIQYLMLGRSSQMQLRPSLHFPPWDLIPTFCHQYDIWRIYRLLISDSVVYARLGSLMVPPEVDRPPEFARDKSHTRAWWSSPPLTNTCLEAGAHWTDISLQYKWRTYSHWYSRYAPRDYRVPYPAVGYPGSEQLENQDGMSQGDLHL